MHPDDRYDIRCTHQVADAVEAVLGRRVTRFRAMCAEHGAVQATKRLIRAPRPSDTFSDLWVERRLDLTVEAVILAEREWDSLFDDTDREAARKRLEDHECSVGENLPSTRTKST